MTVSISLTDLTSLTNETTFLTALNANFAAITTAFESCFNAAGDTMSGTLDMNSEQITNLPYPGSSQSPARLEDI